MRRNIPTAAFVAAHDNAAGQSVAIDAIAQDIVASYAWLCANYAGLLGSQPLQAIPLATPSTTTRPTPG